jgi:hypothetical protein
MMPIKVTLYNNNNNDDDGDDDDNDDGERGETTKLYVEQLSIGGGGRCDGLLFHFFFVVGKAAVAINEE